MLRLAWWVVLGVLTTARPGLHGTFGTPECRRERLLLVTHQLLDSTQREQSC